MPRLLFIFILFALLFFFLFLFFSLLTLLSFALSSSCLAEKVEWAIRRAGPALLRYLFVSNSLCRRGESPSTLCWQDHWAVGAICPTMPHLYQKIVCSGERGKERARERERGKKRDVGRAKAVICNGLLPHKALCRQCSPKQLQWQMYSSACYFKQEHAVITCSPHLGSLVKNHEDH